jgi:hypothetical protein
VRGDRTNPEEAGMRTTVPRHHPAVVLRSQYRHVRALLGVALLVIAALAVAVVLLAAEVGHDGGDPQAAGSRPVPGVNFWPWDVRGR